nr:PEP-CTERM sorting domain-containing protein [uncultured Roseateles sp.]
MKFSKIAAAAMIAAASVPAMATIGVGKPANAELFLIVMDKDASFAFDTGLKFTTFEAAANALTLNQSWNLSSNANWNAYKAIDTDLNDGTKNKGTRWLLAAVFTDGQPAVDQVGFVTTKSPAANLSALTAADYYEQAAQVQANIVNTNQLAGQQAGGVAANGSSVSLVGKVGYFGDLMNFGVLNYFIGNKVGDSSGLYYESALSEEPSDGMQSVAYARTVVKFDGNTLTVSAVPEPETYALMLAGLVAVAGIARRRAA